MPLLGPADPLPGRPARILVAGTSGAGKTSTARRIADLLGVPHVEIDALYHGPGWTPRPTFEADVHRLVAEPAWVTEWQYGTVRAVLAERADLLVWLDLPRARVMRQVIARTVTRRLRRQELWNGNVEPPLGTIFTDPDHIVRWAWKTRRQTAARVAEVLRQRPQLSVVRLRSWSEVQHWVDGSLRATARTPPHTRPTDPPRDDAPGAR